MSFYVDDITVSESVEQSTIEATIAINDAIKNRALGYTPVWTYNSTSATTSGTMTLEEDTGYKIVNTIDANGINITYWLNTLNAMIVTKNYAASFLDNIYVIYVDDNDNCDSTGITTITNNGNNTYTIGAGTIYTSGSTLFIENNKIYASFCTK